jgi:hypothetical protein
MYVRVTRGRSDPANEEQLTRMVEEQLIPAVKRLPGFQSYTGGFDRTTGNLIAISVWETAEQAEAIGGLRGQFQSLVQFDPADVYEITAQA